MIFIIKGTASPSAPAQQTGPDRRASTRSTTQAIFVRTLSFTLLNDAYGSHLSNELATLMHMHNRLRDLADHEHENRILEVIHASMISSRRSNERRTPPSTDNCSSR
jgi:hypothetical protein